MKPRKTITAILTLVLFAGLINDALAQSFPNPVQGNLSITAGAAYQKTDFRWSIAGTPEGTDPNIYSELIYNPIHSAGFHVAAAYNPYRRFSLTASFSRLQTFKGSATDIDYNGDDRTDYIPPDIGDTLFNSHKGNMQQYDIALSYSIFENNIFEVRAGAGFNYSKELFYLRDDALPNLNTTYEAKWQSARIFLNGTVWLTKQLYITPDVSFQPGTYDGVANWNIKEEFKQPVSFIQQANSSGWNYRAQLGYLFNNHIAINATWSYSDWRTGKGVDRLFLKNGTVPETQMNGAFKKSSGWGLSATYTF
ncbi:hypothetical protein U0035_03860 [Niabella yanshanensis]|uniref:Protochlamydia outer membrane protein domain-containing protein n=1 Tax=Niabella yanshanensis TaxID=577386 RepID=A0ABZ0W806_9BACT|nr:hypothetical protein [Niabella yanshanensis]WQD39286.1 hypothetical protein U0035_03860 [Niabella yanshanensis]